MLSTNTASVTPLAVADGPVLIDAGEAILKGALESQVAVGFVAVPSASRFGGCLRAASGEATQKLLARHQCEVVPGGNGARCVDLALAAVRSGRSAVALVPGIDLVGAFAALRDARASFRDPEQGLVLVLEDDPEGEGVLCPRRVAAAIGLPVLEPQDLAEVRDSIEHGLRLSRAGVAPVAIVVHRSMLAAMETILARPNRVVQSVDELILQRRVRSGTRALEGGDLMRVARRLELNVATSLPSPGEREVVGFITVGAANRALVHVLEELGLAGRVPVLHLGLVHPIDESTLQRFLDRVQQVVLLEPRPGSVAGIVRDAAEQLRRRGQRVPAIAHRELPPTPEGEVPVLLADDALRPSVLVRRVLHLLHAVRPSLAVAERLAEPQPELEAIAIPPRGAGLGEQAALAMVRQTVIELDQELRSRADAESGLQPVRLAIGALPPRSDAGDAVVVELYGRRRFLEEGPEIVRQAAREGRRRVVVALDVGGAGESDLVRLADAAIPSGLAARVRVLRADLGDKARMREMLLEAFVGEGVVIVVLSDGPPARLDADAVERTFVERDRLGYQPQLRLVWNAEIACELRPPAIGGLLDEAEERGETPIQGRFESEELGSRSDVVQFRAMALSEQVEVVRTKPPITAFSRGVVGLAPPKPLHAEQGTYRVHLAGVRGGAPGAVGRILADAGRAMGFRVEIASSDEPCGRGRRAWSQLLFVRMRAGEQRAPRTATVPYGEADLVLGADPIETLRALGPDPTLRVASAGRTAVVANRGALEDQFDDASLALCAELPDAIVRCARSELSQVEDFAALCRTNLLSERLLDVALLGVAFQRGLVPVSIDAIEAAVRRADQAGFGRSFEAFSFGRRLAGGSFVRRTTEEREPVERLVRRLTLELVRERFGGRRRASRYALSASGMMLAFGRFGESEAADRATRVVVTALHRAIVWGGTRMMRLYERQLSLLLRADPSGRLAIAAAEPLADAVLVRDILYVLAMSTSLEQRRRIRERLGVRASHGDTLERRFLSRFELVAGARRHRLDFRTSDWPAEVVRLLRHVVPWALRGESRAQEVRAYASSLVERAAAGFATEPERWTGAIERFAMLASDGGLRSMTVAELRAGVEGL